MLAKSSLVMSFAIAKSGLPTSPINNVSPVKTAWLFPFSSIKRYVVDSGVWPGVWIALIFILPIVNSSWSFAIWNG